MFLNSAICFPYAAGDGCIFLKGIAMSVDKAVGLGLAGNEISKKVAGTNEVSAGRSAVATAAGAALGASASGALVVAGVAAAAPLAVPLTLAAGLVSFFASRFD
jgi:hypothetical protein